VLGSLYRKEIAKTVRKDFKFVLLNVEMDIEIWEKNVMRELEMDNQGLLVRGIVNG